MPPIDLSDYVLRVSQDRALWTSHVRFDPSHRRPPWTSARRTGSRSGRCTRSTTPGLTQP
jgi:hypothetical protein